MNIKDIMKIADEFLHKENENDKTDINSPDYAAVLYSRIIDSCDSNQLRALLPNLSFCYRQLKKPQQSIDLYEEVKKNHGDSIISSAFMTSVGSAYCDLKNFKEAEKCADMAFAKAKGQADPVLVSLYRRINKETKGRAVYNG